MRPEIVLMQEEHLKDAALLVCMRYNLFRKQLPLLPSKYGEVDTIFPLLTKIIKSGPALAAISKGRLVGFISGWLMPTFRGRRAAYSPEWANAVEPENGRRIYEELYSHISKLWMDDDYNLHLISKFACDDDEINSWFWLGFGMIAVDAIRDTSQIKNTCNSDIVIRPGDITDINDIVRLRESLRDYMASAPIFLMPSDVDYRQFYEKWLTDPANVIWLAFKDSKAVAFIQVGSAYTDACTIIVDDKTCSLTGAFTDESVRGTGIATELLNHSLEWAVNNNFERCSVDFEPMNPLAVRIWMKYFQPVCYSLARHIDKI
ncbi:MAG: GNAT family N-acetyltransferase [Candidatus Zixiibacteriota bacterium]